MNTIIESKANQSSTIYLECNNNEWYNVRKSQWENSSKKFFINIDTESKKATAWTDYDGPLGEETLYKVMRATDNQYELFFYQPLNTYSTIIKINRHNGEYTSSSFYQTENPAKGWVGNFKKKGICKKRRTPNPLF
tara:strand:- start:101 stop:508 length:408 start_codon:yes stop_codon:yes gene_type:complete